jgi:hypothetical protein
MKNGNSIEKVSHEMDRPSVKDLALDFGKAWEYAPSPEATDHVKIHPATSSSSAASGSPRRAGSTSTRSARAPRRPSPRWPRPTSDVDRAVRPPERPTRRTGRACAPIERGKYLYRIARRHPGEGARARHRRDDGRRQADQGVARRRRPARGGALLLPRGLGRQARLRLSRARNAGRSASPARSSRGTSRC